MDISTGFRELDGLLGGGFTNGALYVIGGRPAMGKTGLMLSMIGQLLTRQERSAVCYTLELPKEQLLKRLLSVLSGVGYPELRTGDLRSSDWKKIAKGAEILGNTRLIVDENPAISTGDLRTKTLSYMMEQRELSAVFVDYLQLLSADDEYRSRMQETKQILAELKALAKEACVPVVVLSQLTRAPERRRNKRPVMSDFKESDLVEKYADAVFGIYRDGYYHRESEDKETAELILMKNRFGNCGIVRVPYQCETAKFG